TVASRCAQPRGGLRRTAGKLRACWQTLLAAPPAPRRRPAALSSSPIQQRYRLLLRLAGPPPGSPGASTEDLPTGSKQWNAAKRGPDMVADQRATCGSLGAR